MARKKKTYSDGISRRKRFHGFKFLTLFMAILVGFELVFGVVGLVGLTTWLSRKPEMNAENFFTQESTLIFDKNGTQIADVGTQLRENVDYEQVPEAMIDAFLAIEDSRYFTHNGFDIPRFTKSIIETVAHGNVQGGSTFTMQLVKLTYFVNDEDGTSRTKDIEYKVQQIALAMELEKQSTKKEIFEMYVNKMNYGGIGNIRGIQKAAQQYFDKNVWELNTSECALLAGIVNSPYYYDPHNYLDHATARRNEVIDMLVHHGYISEDEGNLARAVKVEDLLVDPMHMFNNNGSYRYQAYIDEAIKEAERVTGQDPLNVSMEIYTCMDPEIQTLMEDIQAGNTEIQFFDDKVEIAMISENNQTGEIVGIGGGRNYAGGGSMLFNHATDQYNQPGSTVKPFLDYALAMEYLGWATSHTVTDKPVYMGNFQFTNAGTTSYRGQMDLRQALGISLNTPAILCMMDVIDKIGEDKVKEYLQSFNFSHANIDYFDIQYAIGASSFSVSCKELMAAHAIFMNGGYYIEPHTIKRIVFRSGLQEPLEPSYINRQVLSEQVAYMMSTLLQSNVDINWGNLMNVVRKWYPVYAKTGTTDWGDSGIDYGIPIGEGKDEWMVVQTSNYSSCVWIGYDKPEPYENTYLSLDKVLWNIPGYINSMLLDALNPEGAEGIARPEGVSDITHIVGLFPYVAPVEGMPAEYIRSGLVKSEFATLKAPESADPLEALSSFNASIDSNYNVSFSWAGYPVPEKTEDTSGEGGKLFEWDWLWGPVRYKARIMQNGQTLREISSSSSSDTSNLYNDLAENTNTEVCGFYAYENLGGSSNEVCVAFTTPEKKAIAPGQGSSLSDYQAFADRFGFSLEVTEVPASGDKPAGTVDLILNGHNVAGQEIPRSTSKLYANVYVDK